MNLPPLLVSILEGALKNGATHVDIDRAEVVLWRGTKRVGVGALPPETFPHFVTILRAIASMPEGASDGHLVFHGPAGPLPADIELTEERLRIVFSSDAEATEARHVIETALSESARVGAHRVVIKADGITFWSGETMIGVATSSASMPALLAQARKLGSIPDDAKEGGAVLFGPEGPASLRIELTDDAITLTRPTGPDVG